MPSRRARLDNPDRIRRFLARQVTRWEAGELSVDELSKISATLRVMLSAIEAEQRPTDTR